MLHVRRKEDRAVVFRSQSQLQCEMTAIALTLSSLYNKRRTFEVVDKTTVIMTVTPELAFGMMQTKMRNLMHNRRVTSKMSYVPDHFTDLAETKIIAAVRNGDSLDDVKRRLNDEVDKYAKSVAKSIA